MYFWNLLILNHAPEWALNYQQTYVIIIKNQLRILIKPIDIFNIFLNFGRAFKLSDKLNYLFSHIIIVQISE